MRREELVISQLLTRSRLRRIASANVLRGSSNQPLDDVLSVSESLEEERYREETRALALQNRKQELEIALLERQLEG